MINVAWKPSIILLAMLLGCVSLVPSLEPQATTEAVLSTENAYNPIPSPDGKYIGYVRTGWGRENGVRGFGRSSLVSETAIIERNGVRVAQVPRVDGFLSGWTPDSTNLVCYRDGEYFVVSANGKHSSKGRLPSSPSVLGTERVSYLLRGGIIWSQQDGFHTVLAGPNGVLTQRDGWLGELISPSPDGRYVAITGSWPKSHLWVYDIDLKKWVDFGEAQIHPDRDWDYIKPSWNPWFADNSQLVFFTHDSSVLSISTADGKQRTDINIDVPAGLAAPSPDGQFVAYVTFDPRPRKLRPDLQFWGGTRVWVVDASGHQKPRLVTSKSLDETYGLRWLDNHTVVFDRLADVLFYEQARIWKADVPR